MALFLDPDNDEDEDAFGGGRLPGRGPAGRKPQIDPAVQQRITENARRPKPRPQAPAVLGVPAMQNMQDVADNTMSAIRRENDSRVAQMREMRRLAASQAEEQMKYDYLLRKLAVEQEDRERDRQLQLKGLVAQGKLKPIKRNDGQGWYTDYVA